ncbi:MAG TPA: SDR family NAD(P)-dependent oxidoreductase [Ideonella sp.]|nr:SDR family NAD(P)-dependent oxidoreductase [Ideonella sp.]
MTHLTILTGASRGMGAAMALQRLREGHHLVGISRQASAELEDAAVAAGASLLQWRSDLAEPASATGQLLAWLASQNPGRYSSATLINNAATLPPLRPLAEIDATEVSRSLRVGLEAAMLLTGAFLRGTRAWAVPRKVLNISSGLGRRPQAGSAAYCAAKAGMDLFSRAVALEEASQPNGARIVSLAPGVIDTDMQTQLRAADPHSFPEHEVFVKLQANGQLSTPAEAAAKVLAYLDRPGFGDKPQADVRD